MQRSRHPRLRRAAPWIAVSTLVLGHALLREPSLRGLAWLGADVGVEALAARGRDTRVATWNLENFPRADQDLARLAARLRALEADVIAVQEVHDRDALARLVPELDLYLSERGGRHGQRLGVLVDPRRVEVIGAPQEHAELALGGFVRPAFSVRVRRRDGPIFTVVVVHLKATRSGAARRREQWRLLEHVLPPRSSEGGLVVAGDFNVAGGPGPVTAADELAALTSVMAERGLVRAEDSGCTAYWDGSRRDAYKVSSRLDLIWHAGFTGAPRAVALAHCARHRCQPLRSTEAYPEPDFADLSDHCPVVVDLAGTR